MAKFAACISVNDMYMNGWNVSPSQIEARILAYLSYEPVEEQREAVRRLAEFLTSTSLPGDVFVLNGYAGTGKTSMIGAVVNALRDKGRKSVLLAPTGRAAKVFSEFAGVPAYTIHKRLYRLTSTDPAEARFILAPNMDPGAVFIVDEASMISDDGDASTSLLRMIGRHVFSRSGCQLILVGDNAQLPPVGQEFSPAMDGKHLIYRGFAPQIVSLRHPHRQALESGILNAATAVRAAMEPGASRLRINSSGFADIVEISGNEMEDYLTSSWSRVGKEQTVIITRANWRAAAFNQQIRSQILYSEEILDRNEIVLISRNNYFWATNVKGLDFIANGDMPHVLWIGPEEERYGHRFADVELQFAGVEEIVGATVMVDSLTSDAASITQADLKALYDKVYDEAEGTPSQRLKAVKNSKYFQALQMKYSYCITCHKAQGGQWRHVYIDLGGIAPEQLTSDDFLRWFYTALTRASERVYLVNSPLESY